MKKQIQYVAILTLLCYTVYICVPASAQSTSSSKSSNDGEKITISKPDKPIRPFDLGEEEIDIECSYLEGVISVTFAEPEGMAKVYIYDMGETSALLAIHTISTASTARIAVPTDPGFYRIAITTSPGNEYEGYYTIF